jgi:hypothetical protein
LLVNHKSGSGGIIDGVLVNGEAVNAIDTVRDAVSFQVMSFAAFLGWTTSQVFEGGRLVRWMEAFYSGATTLQLCGNPKE